MAVDCTACRNSACCKLSVCISRDEYKHYVDMGMGHLFETFAEREVKRNPDFLPFKEQIDQSTNDNDYAELIKGDDGYCVKLNRETMLCTIYDIKPHVCSWYTNDKCEEIRLI